MITFKGGNDIVNEALILDKVTNPDAHKTNVAGIDVIPALELGGINRNTGALEDATDRVRTKDFIPVHDGATVHFTQSSEYRLGVMAY